MNTVVDAGSGKTSEELASLKTITTVVYALQALSFAFGVTALVGLIINYVKRDDVAGTLYESHFNWQIRTFWWACCGRAGFDPDLRVRLAWSCCSCLDLGHLPRRQGLAQVE